MIEVVIHEAFVYMFAVCVKHNVGQWDRKLGKYITTEKQKKQSDFIMSPHNGTLSASPQITYEAAVWELDLWRPCGFGREGGPCSACMSCQRIC